MCLYGSNFSIKLVHLFQTQIEQSKQLSNFLPIFNGLGKVFDHMFIDSKMLEKWRQEKKIHKSDSTYHITEEFMFTIIVCY
jgi:hypothetical protein